MFFSFQLMSLGSAQNSPLPGMDGGNVGRSREPNAHEAEIVGETSEKSTCSLYISRVGEQDQAQGALSRAKLEDAIRTVEPSATWNVCETPCGLIATFACEHDVDQLLQRRDLAAILDTPVQVDFRKYFYKNFYK